MKLDVGRSVAEIPRHAGMLVKDSDFGRDADDTRNPQLATRNPQLATRNYLFTT